MQVKETGAGHRYPHVSKIFTVTPTTGKQVRDLYTKIKGFFSNHSTVVFND